MKRDEILAIYLARLIILFYGLVFLLGVIWNLDSFDPYDFLKGITYMVAAFFIGLCPLKACSAGRLKNIYIGFCIYGILLSLVMSLEKLSGVKSLIFIAGLAASAASFGIMLSMKIKYGEERK